MTRTRHIRSARSIRDAAGIGAVLLAGTTSAQIDTREWLLPESGNWSDAPRWSESNVPDTEMEIARLSPLPDRPIGEMGGVPTATVDGVYDVYRVLGNGSVRVVIDPGSALNVVSGVAGEDGGVLAIDVGRTDAEGGAALNLVGGRGFFRSTYIRLADPGEGSTLDFNTVTVIDENSVIEGAGEITGIINNRGLIRSLRYAPTGIVELSINSADITNYNELYADSGAYMVFDGSVIDQQDGLITSGTTVTFLDTDLSGGVLRGIGRGKFVTEGESSFAEVHIDKVVIQVDGDLALLGNEIRNDGFIYVDDEDGKLVIDEEVSLEGFGKLDFGGSAGPATLVEWSPEGELRNGPEHSITGWGDIGVPLINEGKLAVRGTFNSPGFIKIQGAFEQHPGGVLELTFDQELSALNADRVIIDRSTVELAGTLRVRLFGNAEQFVGVEVPVVRILQNNPSQTVTGAFDDVIIVRNPGSPGVSPIAGVEYLPDRVNLTLYCIADINRDGSVSPADFSAWIAAFNEGNELADTNLDGQVEPDDFAAWMSAYNGGCGR